MNSKYTSTSKGKKIDQTINEPVELEGELIDEQRQNDNEEIIYEEILKSKRDLKEYRGIKLKNGLKVMLISDPETNESAASLNVNVGSYFDPEQLQGLAHFLEHMLFLGTEKYPESNEFIQFLHKHGGYNNACTGSLNTVFYFKINPDYLEQALDRFVQFFISPTFDSKYVEKELNSIQSEYDLKSELDSVKSVFVDKETCDQTHDFHKFNVGNIKSLKESSELNQIDLRERLIAFYNEFYSANLMTLCVIGKESLDELYEMICKRLPFNEIPNKNVKAKKNDKCHFKREHLQKEIKIATNKDLKSIFLDFIMLDYFADSNDYSKKYNVPGYYISRLFNDHSKGSLYSQLKDKGWINSLSMGYSKFQASLTVRATEDGYQHLDEIIQIIFQFIDVIKKEDIKWFIIDELNSINQIDFDNQEKSSSPLSTVQSIASSLHVRSFKNVVKLGYFSKKLEPEFVAKFLSYLKPENLRIILINKKFQDKTDRIEKHYSVNYSYNDISKERIDFWTNVDLNSNLISKFEFLKPNEFIPTNFELVEREEETSKYPKLIRKDKYSEIWYKQDDEFNVPKAMYEIMMINPYIPNDPMTCICRSIYSNLIFDSILDLSSSAIRGGLFTVASFDMITAIGYSQKLSLVLPKITEKLIDFNFSRERFDKIKESYFRSFEDTNKMSIIFILTSKFEQLMYEGSYTDQDYLDVKDEITFENVEQVVRSFYSRLFFKIFIYGNVTKNDIELVERSTKDVIMKKYNPLPIADKYIPYGGRFFKLDDHSFYIYDENSEQHSGNGIKNYYCFGFRTDQKLFEIRLLVDILSVKFYDHLRTQEQLGYSVQMYESITATSIGIFCIIESKYRTQFLDNRIEKFIEWSKKYLNEDLTDDEFNKFKESLKVSKKRKAQNLTDKAFEYIFKILDDAPFDFDELDTLEKITKQDVIELFNENLIKNKRKLSVRITGTKKVNANSKNEKKEDSITNLLESLKKLDHQLGDLNIGEEEGSKSNISELAVNLQENLQELNQSIGLDDKLTEQIDSNDKSQEEKNQLVDKADDEIPKNAIVIENIQEFQENLAVFPAILHSKYKRDQ